MALESDLLKRLCHLENSELELLMALAKVRSERLRLLSAESINVPPESSPAPSVITVTAAHSA